MIPFTLGSYKFDIPSDYGELTFNQFYAIRKSNGDILELLSIISGLSKEVWEQAKDIDIDAKLMPYLQWMREPFKTNSFFLPARLKINNQYYDRPKDIRLKTFGQKLALQNEIDRVQKEGGTDVDLFAYALALYFQPIYFNNKYDSDQVDQLLPLVMECKLEEGYPIASFFLSSYLKSLQSKKRNFLTVLHGKRYEQVLTDSQNSKSLEQYTLFQKVCIRIMKRFSRWIIARSSSRYGTKKNNLITKEG